MTNHCYRDDGKDLVIAIIPLKNLYRILH